MISVRGPIDSETFCPISGVGDSTSCLLESETLVDAHPAPMSTSARAAEENENIFCILLYAAV